MRGPCLLRRRGEGRHRRGRALHASRRLLQRRRRSQCPRSHADRDLGRRQSASRCGQEPIDHSDEKEHDMTPALSLGVQLYSGRKFPPVEAQLETIARYGLFDVETFALFDEDVDATKRMLDAHGLSAARGHFALAMLEGEARSGRRHRATAWHGVRRGTRLRRRTSGDRRGMQGARRPPGRHRGASSSAELRFAWHTHDFEFQPLEDGSFPIQHLLGDRLQWEADLAWVVRGARRSATLDRTLSRPHSVGACQGYRSARREGGRGRLG